MPTQRNRNSRLSALGGLFLFLLPIAGPGAVSAHQQFASASGSEVLPLCLDRDSYEIYGILLDSTAQHYKFVIQAETISWGGATPEKMGIHGRRNFRKIWGGALEDYAAKYQQPEMLIDLIHIATRYDVVPARKASTDDLFMGGIYSFSRVGFDRKRRHAIVEMDLHCPGLCGGGRPHFFEKQNGRWREVLPPDASIEEWVS